MINEDYNILHLLGNHEDILLTPVNTLDKSNIKHWYRNNGEITIESFCKSYRTNKRRFLQ